MEWRLLEKQGTYFRNETYMSVTNLQHDSVEKFIAVELGASVRGLQFRLLHIGHVILPSLYCVVLTGF